MTHHRQLNRWLQPGGHADGNPDLLYVAINEAREETGLTKLKVKSDKIFDLDIHNIPKFNNVPQHFHYDIRFILETKRKPNEIIISKESYDVAWIHRSVVLTKNNVYNKYITIIEIIIIPYFLKFLIFKFILILNI